MHGLQNGFTRAKWVRACKMGARLQNGCAPAKWGTDAGLGCCAAQHLHRTSVHCGMPDGRTDGRTVGRDGRTDGRDDLMRNGYDDMNNEIILSSARLVVSRRLADSHGPSSNHHVIGLDRTIVVSSSVGESVIQRVTRSLFNLRSIACIISISLSSSVGELSGAMVHGPRSSAIALSFPPAYK